MKIYKTLFLGLGLIALSSCSDFLNQTSPSELDLSLIHISEPTRPY